jgi:hypothetical protein
MIIHCLECKKDIGKIEYAGSYGYIYLEENGILSVRPRMDGHLGFQCECGNDSRLCEAEKGRISYRRPNRQQIQEILIEVKAHPTEFTETDTYKDVDGFRIIKEL